MKLQVVSKNRVVVVEVPALYIEWLRALKSSIIDDLKSTTRYLIRTYAFTTSATSEMSKVLEFLDGSNGWDSFVLSYDEAQFKAESFKPLIPADFPWDVSLEREMVVYQVRDGKAVEAKTAVVDEAKLVEGRVNPDGFFKLHSPLTSLGLADSLLASVRKVKVNPDDYKGSQEAYFADNKIVTKHKRNARHFHNAVRWPALQGFKVFNTLDLRFELIKGELKFHPYQDYNLEYAQAVALAFAKLLYETSNVSYAELCAKIPQIMEYLPNEPQH